MSVAMPYKSSYKNNTPTHKQAQINPLKEVQHTERIHGDNHVRKNT